MSLEDCKNVAEGFDVIRRRVMALAAVAAVAESTPELIGWNDSDALGAINELHEAVREAVDATEASWRADRAAKEVQP